VFTPGPNSAIFCHTFVAEVRVPATLEARGVSKSVSPAAAPVVP